MAGPIAQGTNKTSGVTKVDVTRGGNWGCHPYFFMKKTDELFLLIAVTFIDFTRVSPRTVLPVLPRLTTILCKFTHKKIPLGVTPWRVSPGAVPRSP